MEQTVVFEQKVYLTPKDMNRMADTNLDDILLEHLRDSLENKCSQHGFVIPGTVEIISRSMGHLDNGRFTGNVVFHSQVRSEVYNPVNGTRLTGSVLKKNKMGLYVIYKDAIRVLVARDLHRDSEEFEAIQVGDIIEIEIRKSRFQIRDPFILSIGVYLGKATEAGRVEVPATAPVEKAKPAPPLPPLNDIFANLPALERNEELIAERAAAAALPPAPAAAAPLAVDEYDIFDQELETVN